MSMTAAFLAASTLLAQAAPPATLRAPPLRKGDTVALVSPASPLPDPQIQAAVENLERRGFSVKVRGGRTARRGYLSADDETRAAELNAAFRDPEVKAIFCLRGGYGSPRILDRIDYEALQSSPKIIVGYSDATALLLAVRRRTGLIVFHGPMGREWASNHGPTSYTEKYLWGAIGPESRLLADWGGARLNGMKAPTALVDGAAEGTLIGGNLSMLVSLLGTPYEPDTRGAVLFLEEVGERPFRIDRMLNQLRLAGKLKELRGVVLGIFTACDTRDPEGDLSIQEVFLDYFGSLGIPVLVDFPAGHIPDQATLPLGAKVLLDSTRRTLSILERPVAGEPEAAQEAAQGAGQEETPVPRDPDEDH